MRFDPIRAIEAAYTAGEDEAWLGAILDALAPLDLGLGMFAAKFRIVNGRLVHEAGFTRGMATDWSARHTQFWERDADPALVRAFFPPSPPVLTFRKVIGGLPLARLTMPDLSGPPLDGLGLLAQDHDGRGVVVSVASPRAIDVPPRTVSRLARVSAHLLSARRLRARAAVAGPEHGDVEAVLDPEGRVAHAAAMGKSGGARESLSEAVLRTERARGRLRRTDPDDALALWTGLVDGRWSLVDHVERDGRRWVLARRNEPGVTDPKALTARERDVVAYAVRGHSNKYIGYTLGIAPSTVATHLEAALAKLQFRSRRALVAALGAACDHAPARASHDGAPVDGAIG